MAQGGDSGESNPFSMLQNIFANKGGEDELFNLVKDLQNSVKDSGWPQENCFEDLSNENGKGKDKMKANLCDKTENTTEFFNNKGKKEDSLTKVNQNIIKSADWVNKEIEEVKALSTITSPVKQEISTGKPKEDLDSLQATVDDEVLNRVKDLRNSIKNLFCADVKTDEPAVTQNNIGNSSIEKDLGLESIESLEVVTSKGKRDAQVMDLLSELSQNVKSSDWLERQSEAVKAGASITLPEEQGTSSKLLEEDFEIMPTTVDQSDPLVGMMKDLHQSIMNSGNWVEENTEKIKQENPDLITSIMESKNKQSKK